ncbi:hypothetical protein LCGC14_1798460 [marine sediment metagenome]|uniref:Uncharacterized protein n=1 Tax=marine sediment metagenome TaxID=412755 RepID=A0A0F9GQF3_9ZZZZ
MKGGVTKRIEDTVKALEQGQLKKALSLTDREGLESHRQFVEQAARTCLANKGDKEACTMAIEKAKEQVQETITLPIDDTSLEGVEDYLSPESPAEKPNETQPASAKTDEELFEECEECHVAVAAARIAEICAERPQEAGDACRVISERLEDENTEPADWIKAMVETAEQAQGEAKTQMVDAVTDLTEYLQRRNSPLLNELDEGEVPSA